MQRFRFGAILLALLLAGCATQPGMVMVGDISDLPQTLLPGAELQHARSIAMGSARSKGWTIKESAPNRILLERELRRDSPQAVALGLGQSATPPRIQVETDLVERSDGVIVALRSFVLADPGLETEQRIDYTRDYESELMISLSALQTAWLNNRAKIAADVPVPDAAVAAAQGEADAASDGTGEAVLADTAPEVEPAPASDQRASSGPVSTSTDVTMRPPPAPAASAAVAAPASNAEPMPSPVLPPLTSTRLPAPSSAGLPSSTVPAVAGPIGDARPSTTNDMLVLDSSARKGLWAYYAEDYARLRGCAVDDLGAVLLQETSSYELHEVHCSGSANFLLRCQGGVCEEMR
jgi:hypothetical protein